MRHITKNMASKTEENLHCLDEFKCYFNSRKMQSVVDIFATALQTIDNIPNLDEEKEEVATCVAKVRTAVHTSFIHGRSYVMKAHSLAEFICEEKEEVIKLIEENNADEFKDFLEEVLDKSQGCQKDIKALLQYINETQKPAIAKEQQKVQAKHRDATVFTVVGGGGAAIGAAGAIVGIGGITTAGALVGGAAGIGGIAVLEAVVTGVGLGAIVSVAATGPVGAGILAAGGLAIAIAGLAMALKGAHSWYKNSQLKKYCENALKAIEEMTSCLDQFSTELTIVAETLRLAIDHHIEDTTHDQDKLKKLSAGQRFVKRGLKSKINAMADETKCLKEYCQVLKDAPNLKTFAKLCKEKKATSS